MGLKETLFGKAVTPEEAIKLPKGTQFKLQLEKPGDSRSKWVKMHIGQKFASNIVAIIDNNGHRSTLGLDGTNVFLDSTRLNALKIRKTGLLR